MAIQNSRRLHASSGPWSRNKSLRVSFAEEVKYFGVAAKLYEEEVWFPCGTGSNFPAHSQGVLWHKECC